MYPLYQSYLLLEKGLSENSRLAYISDLERFEQWLGPDLNATRFTVSCAISTTPA